MSYSVVISESDFDANILLEQLHTNAPQIGAVASFLGVVREAADSNLEALYIEHYPGMTEAEIGRIIELAMQRWSLHYVQVYHALYGSRLAQLIAQRPLRPVNS
jgi:molybdopterin synthase catalytic subunit